MSDVTAQTLYDLRSRYMFCSGNDLSEFFKSQCRDPSPKGGVKIDMKKARNFVINSIEVMRLNSPSLRDSPELRKCLREMGAT